MYGIDSTSGENCLLAGSPKSITCRPQISTAGRDAFRLATGVVIYGEFLSFDGHTFRINTANGVIEKGKEEITGILLGVAP